MAIYGVTGSVGVHAEMVRMQTRLREKFLASIVFEGLVKKVNGLWVVAFSPRLPRLDLLGFGLIVAAIFLRDIPLLSWFFLILGVGMAFLSVFWTVIPYVVMTHYMLRRFKYKRDYRILYGENLIRRLLE